MRIRPSSRKFLAAALLVWLAPPVSASEWDWMVTPYAWASSIGTDVHTDRPAIDGSTEMEFRDILDKLDGSLQLHVEGRGDGLGAFADFTYLGLADTRSGAFARTESDLDTRLFEAALVWTPGRKRDRGLDLFAGLRYLDADLKVAIEPVNPQLAGRVLEASDSYLDAMVGGRYTWAPSNRWRITTRADVSFGETEGSWNASGMAQYALAHGSVVLGYRHMEIELESNGIRTDLTMTGPVVGYTFAF